MGDVINGGFGDDKKKKAKAKAAAILGEAKPARKPRAKPVPQVEVNGDGNVVGNNNTVIKTERVVRKIVARPVPGVEHINEVQVARLHSLKDEILKLEAATKRDPATPQRVWSSLNKKMSVGSMRMIPSAKFAAAERYMLTWIGQLMDRPSAQKKAADTVWKRRVAYIQTNMKVLDCEIRVRDYMEKHWGVRSLKDLPDLPAMEQVYRYVASLKRRLR